MLLPLLLLLDRHGNVAGLHLERLTVLTTSYICTLTTFMPQIDVDKNVFFPICHVHHKIICKE